EVNRFLELGPDGVLTALGQACSQELPLAVLTPSMRDGRPEGQTLITAVAKLFAHGMMVDWGRLFAERGAKQVELPTYAFQRQRYWLNAGPMVGGNATSVGLQPAQHPFLQASMHVADGEGVLLTGQLSLQTH